MRPRRPRRRLRPKIARPPVLVHKFQTRVLLELALRPAGQATVRPERDAAVPGRCVTRVGGKQADGDLVLARGLVDRETEVVRIR